MQPGLSALLHLRATLGAIGDAIRDGRVDTLLRSESELGEALGRLRAAASPLAVEAAGAGSAELREAVKGVRQALRRCERLGSSSRDVVRAVLVAHGRAGAYDRGAREAFQPARGAVDARG